MGGTDRDKSFWSTIPGIVTGVAALTTALGGLIAVLYTTGIIGDSSAPSSLAPSETRPPDRVSVPQAALPLPTRTSATASDNCLSGYFQGIREDRVFALEESTRDHTLIGREQTKEDPTGIKLTDNRQTVGALRLSFFLSGETFKIESVVDSSCHQVEEYSVEGSPGEKRVLQNWDTLRIKFGSQTYALRLGVGDGELRVAVVRFVP